MRQFRRGEPPLHKAMSALAWFKSRHMQQAMSALPPKADTSEIASDNAAYRT